MEKFNIKGVEIFSIGKWNGDDYTNADLEEMVKAFDELKPGMSPHLKLGHDPKQELLQKDGLPAAGYVERVYIKGGKLLADFKDIPKKIYQLIEAKAYKKVSSEIFWNLKVGEKVYKRALAAVALLGADTPGVMNLNDILAMYSKAQHEDLKIYETEAFEIKEHINHGKGNTMTPEEKAKLELELKQAKEKAEAQEQELKKFTADKEAQEKELEQLKQFKIEAEQREAAAKAEAEKAKLEQFVTTLKSEKLCTPSMEQMVRELLGPEKKEYTVKVDKEDKQLSKEDLLKETLKLFKAASEVNFEESSTDGDKDSKVDEDAQDAKIREYMAEHKCTYGTAAKAILAQQN